MGLQLLWALHQWTTTLDNNLGHCNHQAKRKKCCGQCINEQQHWTLQPSGKNKKNLDIASLDSNIGHYNCCGHCINGQQHWTTTLDIATINNNNNNSKKKAVDS